MQAVRAERRRSYDARWLQHLSILAALGLLFTWVTTSRPQATAQLAQHLPGPFRAPPSSPAKEWVRVRVPARPTITPDPAKVPRAGATTATEALASPFDANAVIPV